MQHVYLISQQKPRTERKQGSILGVMEQDLEEGFHQVFFDDESVYSISKELWSPISDRLTTTGSVEVTITTEGSTITEVIVKEE